MKFAQLLAKDSSLVIRTPRMRSLLEEFDRGFSASGPALGDRFAQLIDTLGYFVREFHFAARVEINRLLRNSPLTPSSSMFSLILFLYIALLPQHRGE